MMGGGAVIGTKVFIFLGIPLGKLSLGVGGGGGGEGGGGEGGGGGGGGGGGWGGMLVPCGLVSKHL